MILVLDDHWYIDADTTSVALVEKRVITGDSGKGIAPKAENIGKVRDIQHGFYGTVAQAAQAYMNKNIASMQGMLTATQIIAAWTDMAARVEKACINFKKSSLTPSTLPQA